MYLIHFIAEFTTISTLIKQTCQYRRKLLIINCILIRKTSVNKRTGVIGLILITDITRFMLSDVFFRNLLIGKTNSNYFLLVKVVKIITQQDYLGPIAFWWLPVQEKENLNLNHLLRCRTCLFRQRLEECSFKQKSTSGRSDDVTSTSPLLKRLHDSA